MSRSTHSAVFLTLLLFALPPAHSANLSGRVSNPDGAPVPGAQITLQQTDSGFSSTAVTAEDGSFDFPAVPSGVYTIVIRKQGFADLTQESVSLGISNQNVQFDFRLRPAEQQTVVRGVEELNPNLFYVKLDTNEITRDLGRRGADPQFLREFRSQENYFGAQYGSSMRTIEWARPRSSLAGFHGSLYEAHQNSRLNARNFFTVGELQPWRRNEYGGALGGPLLSERLRFDFAASQTRDTGYVNGNAQVPLASERVPLTTDPQTFALVSRLLDAFPDEVPNLPQVSLRQLNTNAVRDIRSTGFSTSFAFRPNDADQLVVEQRFLDSTEEPFEFVIGQNPVTLLRPQSVHLTYTHPVSPQTLLRLSHNLDRLSVFLDATDTYKNLLAPLGLDVVPDISFGHDLTRIGPGASYPRRRVENRFHYAADLTQARGAHSLSAGLLVSRLQTNDLQSDNNRGAFSFGSDFGRTAVENFLFGTPSSFTVATGDLYRGFRNWEMAFYSQDAFRVRPTLTISVGLRYEVVTAPVEVNGLTAIPFGTDANNFAPQFGFAWNPGRGGTTLRGGYGVAFSSIFPVLYQRARFNPPAVQVITANFGGRSEEHDLLNPLRGADLRRSGLNLISPDLVAPYSHIYNFGIERQLPSNVALRIGYIGSRTLKLPVNAVSNRARPVPGIPTINRTIDERRPDPRYREISTMQNMSIAYLDALQVALDKRISRGLTWNLRYTWSKGINTTGTQNFANISGTGHTSTVEDNIVGDLKSVEDFDVPHSLTIGYRYELPAGSGSGIPSRLLGGWRVSGTTTFKSGTPTHVHTGGDSPGFGNVDGVGGDRPNLLDTSILGISLDHPDTSYSLLAGSCTRPNEIAPDGTTRPYMRCTHFDTNVPPGGRGNLGFQTFRSDGIANWNLALERDFVLREPVALRFRSEFINFFNHPQFERPDDEIGFEPFAKIINTANRGRVIQLLLRLQF